MSGSGGPGVGPDVAHSSPQAVFTSFKLPKPGPTGPVSGAPSPAVAAAAAAAAGIPLGFPFSSAGLPLAMSGAPPPSFVIAPTTTSATTSSPTNVLNAPLGGLPAMAQQLQAMVAEKKAEERRSPSPQAQKRPQSPPSSGSPLSGEATPAKQAKLDLGAEQSATLDNTSIGSDGSPPKGGSVAQIKARGTYYPLTAFPTSMPQGAVMRKDASPPRERASGSSGESTTARQGRFLVTAACELTSEPCSACPQRWGCSSRL